MLAAAGLALALAVVAPTVANADPPVEPPGPAHIDRTLDRVRVSSPAHDAAMADLEATVAALANARERLETATDRIGDLVALSERLGFLIDVDTAIRDAADRRIFTLSARLRVLALQAYVGISDDAEENAALSMDGDAFLRARSSVTLRDSLLATTRVEYLEQIGISDAAGDRIDASTRELTQVGQDLAATRSEARDAQRSIDDNRVGVFRGLAAVRDTRALAIVEGTDLPLVVLDAYVNGARRANEWAPSCRLHWSLLAGIGRIESGQGTHGGAAVRADGTLSRPIFGIPLDGNHDTQVIRNEDGSFMRAQGPMQFLPSTWRATAVDGDDDDEADIQNLYDAAATAGAYLCRTGGDLSDPAQRRRAILTYNFSGAYVADVTRAMDRYAEAVPELDEPEPGEISAARS